MRPLTCRNRKRQWGPRLEETMNRNPRLVLGLALGAAAFVLAPERVEAG